MIVRTAKKSDKQEVLKFCTDTFEWGDYIDQVWDAWSADPHGKLYVVRSKNNKFPVTISQAPSVLALGGFGLKASGSILRTDERRLPPP